MRSSSVCRSISTALTTLRMIPTTPYVPPVDALILPTSTPSENLSSLALAAQILIDGGLVAFPTETVYGLGASALSESAVKRIFKAKGRPSDNPLIVHVSDRAMLGDLIPGGAEKGICGEYEALMRSFWPGPLSLIFNLDESTLSPPRNKVAPSVRAGAPSIAIRMPSHPLALELIRTTGLPLAAPSANLSSRPSPTRAQHVVEDLGLVRGVGAILDGGDCQIGVESTVVDFWRRPVVESSSTGKQEGEVRILRAGGVSAEEIEKCLTEAGFGFGGKVADGKVEGKVQVYKRDFSSGDLEERPTTPGMKYKHYSPSNSTVILVRSKDSKDIPTLDDIVRDMLEDSTSPKSVGLMLTEETLARMSLSTYNLLEFSSLPPTDSPTSVPIPNSTSPPLYSYSIGSQSRPLESAQRLFAGLRFLDEIKLSEGRRGVDVILLECVEEVGVGLAVMERSRKAAGGQKQELSFRS